MNILIVDDSIVMRRLHKNTLITRRFPENALFEASNGEKAMEILRKKQIGLFLLDWNMPQLNGISFVKKLRSMPEYAKTPVIMITSEAAKFSVLTAIQAGVTDYVVKPVNDAVLWGKILPHLRNH